MTEKYGCLLLIFRVKQIKQLILKADILDKKMNGCLIKKVFKMAISKLNFKLNFKPEIDLFASRNNCQIEIFVSWKPEPESYAIDAFSISWPSMKLYCFPPFSVIPAVLQKMVVVVDKAMGILIMPNWPTQLRNSDENVNFKSTVCSQTQNVTSASGNKPNSQDLGRTGLIDMSVIRRLISSQ